MNTVVEDLLALRNERRRGVTFVQPNGERKRVSYAELVDRSLRFSAGLRNRGLSPGDSLVLMLSEPEEALIAILGSMLAGNPPAPIYPPANMAAVPASLRYLEHVAERSKARHLVTDSRLLALLGAAPTKLHRFSVVADAKANGFQRVSPEDVAFLQFTSGSTSAPKGVQVTHGCLRANLHMIRTSSRMDDNSCVVTWLPVYHDMGLIGTVLNAITMRINLSVLSPLTFLRTPRLWLEEITRSKGTHTAAPNFAYGLCVKRVRDVSGLDLSSMTTFICGAEPIMPETLERFAEHFAPAGLAPGALAPAYGLAEATLAVTFTPHMRGLACDCVDPEALGADGEARPAVGKLLRVPSCGVPMPGVEVRIAGEGDVVLGERRVGRIQVRGPSVTPGYVNDEKATEETWTRDGWLRTGDLGYMAGGELFPCGRSKDLIILRGRNVHAHDVEAVVSVVNGVRTGNVVAFGVPSPDGERLVVAAEVREGAESELVARTIRAELQEALSVVPDDVRVVEQGALPKTSSGKLKRAEARERYLSSQLFRRRNTGEWLAAVVRSGVGHIASSLTRPNA